jgi:pyridoxamine 5'-phosphate oxidase
MSSSDIKLSQLQALREDYKRASLDEKDLHTDPLKQFQIWLNQALDAKMPEPNAMSLATVDPDGQASVRIVLLKGMSESLSDQASPEGFVFYTNYQSRKGLALAHEPRAALLFCWLELERQVRIEGRIHRVRNELSEQYFRSRPLASQLGAQASPQSQTIASRQVLEHQFQTLQEAHSTAAGVSKPEHWGGYILIPTMLEFWQGRRSRLHDRLRYRRPTNQNSVWNIDRLAP